MKRQINGKHYSKTIGVKKGEFASFDSKGELISSGVSPDDLLSFPEGGEEGEILYYGESHPYWGNPEEYVEDLTEELTYSSEFDAIIESHMSDIASLHYQFLKIGDYNYRLTLVMRANNDITLVGPNGSLKLFSLGPSFSGKSFISIPKEYQGDHSEAMFFDDVFVLDGGCEAYLSNGDGIYLINNSAVNPLTVLADCGMCICLDLIRAQ